MPERIVRKSNHIEIRAVVHLDILVKPLPVQCVVAAVVEMYHNLCSRTDLLHGADACADKACNICIIWNLSLRPEQSI